MTTVIFVHGTSVRKAGYEAALAAIERGLSAVLKPENRAKVEVRSCLWGDSRGVRLNANGLSIPEYDASGGVGGLADSVVEDDILLWEMLTYDPLYELQGLGLRPTKAYASFHPEDFTDAIRALPSPELAAKLTAAGLSPEAFATARDTLVGQSVLAKALASSEGMGECRLPAARALIADAAALARVEPRPAAVSDPDCRDELVEAIANAIGPPDMSVIAWAKNLTHDMAKRIGNMGLRSYLWVGAAGGTPLVRRYRGEVTDRQAAFAGDILLYQARGQDIRGLIRSKIESADPPVVLLGHSLGGIACVDLLVLERLPEVKLLVTVGSQAPFLYELNALPSLRYGEPLPNHFVERWVNIYDPRDFLSYQLGTEGKQVFPSASVPMPTFADFRVDNRLRFPDAHSGYWANRATWEIIAKEIALL